MAPARLTHETRASFADRIGRMESETPRRWGTMQAIDMIVHLRRTVEVSLGEIEVPDDSGFFARNILGPIAFSGYLPWPKGRLKAPATFLGIPDGDIDVEKELLMSAMDRFIEASEREPGKKALSPAFGWLTLGYWRQVHGIHAEHHLRQFGV